MTDERLTQIFYRLMRDHVSVNQLCDLINETSESPAIFSNKDIELEARHLVSFL